jgi:hypothetical protein
MTIIPYPRRRLSSTAREALYDRCRGEAEYPTCNICGQMILVGDAWDESHDPEGPPHCFGGEDTGVAIGPATGATAQRSSARWTPRPPVTAKSTSGHSRPGISCPAAR